MNQIIIISIMNDRYLFSGINEIHPFTYNYDLVEVHTVLSIQGVISVWNGEKDDFYPFFEKVFI